MIRDNGTSGISPRRIGAALLWGAGLVLLGSWVGFFLWGRHLSDAAWAKFLPGFDLAEAAFGPSPLGSIPGVVIRILGLLTALLVVLALLHRYWERLQKPATICRLFSTAVAAGCCCILLQNLFGRTEQAPWYDVRVMMTNPSSVPVFGQRLLLIWPAMFLKHLVSRLTYIQAFILIQAAGIVFSVYAIGQWAALFIGKNLKFLGQILLTFLLLPTMVSYQAHDIGVILTYTLCFLFLYLRQYWLFVLTFFVAIFNHQNVLLLVPTAGFILYGKECNRTIVRLLAISLAVYFLTQYLLNRAIPIPLTHEQKVWWNMRQIAGLHRTMIFGIMLTVPWYAGAAVIFRFADPFLKRAAVLLPMQLAIYSLYGQLNEPRLFNGFLPILIGIYLCCLRHWTLQVTSHGSVTPSPAAA